MQIAMLFTYSVCNFFIYQECNMNYLKFYHGIFKFQLDHKEQKMAIKSYFIA